VSIYYYLSVLSIHHCFITILWTVRRKLWRWKREIAFSLGATHFFFA